MSRNQALFRSDITLGQLVFWQVGSKVVAAEGVPRFPHGVGRGGRRRHPPPLMRRPFWAFLWPAGSAGAIASAGKRRRSRRCPGWILTAPGLGRSSGRSRAR